MKIYLIERYDDGVSILTVHYKKTPKGKPILDENGQFIYSGTIDEEIDKASVSDGNGNTVPFRTVIKDVIQVSNNFQFPDRKLRNAWKVSNGTIVEDLDKSKELLRQVRNNALEELDLASLRESRKPAPKQSIIDADAQTLRNVTDDSRFENINGIKQLLNQVEALKKKHEAKAPARAIQVQYKDI